MRLKNLQPRNGAFMARLKRAYRYSELRKLHCWLKGRTLHWAVYLALTFILVGGLLILHNYLYHLFFVVRVDEHEVGLVREAEEVEFFLEELMEKCSFYYGMDVYPQQNITLTWESRLGQEADAQGAREALRQQISLATEALMVMVDSKPVVPISTEAELETIIGLLCSAYVSQNENVTLLEVELVEELRGEVCEVLPEQVYTPEEVALLLTRQVQPEEGLVASREVVLSRSGRSGLNDDEIEQEIPVLHVITVEKATLPERIPFPTTYTNNSNMFIGETRVVTAGQDGRKEIAYRITRENGVEVDREALSERVIEEPVTRVVERGTGTRFTWPVAGGGRLTQGFRGAAHMGIDIAAPTGTAVLAADGGVVVRSAGGWPMGNYIILYHGSYWTLYLHNSSNLVSAGQRVARGQTIARVGSTGRSTGPHLHFEVRRCNGSGVWSSWHAHPAINPLQFFR